MVGIGCRKYVAGGIFGKQMGDDFDYRQSVNGSMAKQKVLLDSGRRIGLTTTSKGKLTVVDEHVLAMFLYNENRR